MVVVTVFLARCESLSAHEWKVPSVGGSSSLLLPHFTPSAADGQIIFIFQIEMRTIHRIGFHNHGEGPYYGLLLVECR